MISILKFTAESDHLSALNSDQIAGSWVAILLKITSKSGQETTPTKPHPFSNFSTLLYQRVW